MRVVLCTISSVLEDKFAQDAFEMVMFRNIES